MKHVTHYSHYVTVFVWRGCPCISKRDSTLQWLEYLLFFIGQLCLCFKKVKQCWHQRNLMQMYCLHMKFGPTTYSLQGIKYPLFGKTSLVQLFQLFWTWPLVPRWTESYLAYIVCFFLIVLCGISWCSGKSKRTWTLKLEGLQVVFGLSNHTTNTCIIELFIQVKSPSTCIPKWSNSVSLYGKSAHQQASSDVENILD